MIFQFNFRIHLFWLLPSCSRHGSVYRLQRSSNRLFLSLPKNLCPSGLHFQVYTCLASLESKTFSERCFHRRLQNVILTFESKSTISFSFHFRYLYFTLVFLCCRPHRALKGPPFNFNFVSRGVLFTLDSLFDKSSWTCLT